MNRPGDGRWGGCRGKVSNATSEEPYEEGMRHPRSGCMGTTSPIDARDVRDEKMVDSRPTERA